MTTTSRWLAAAAERLSAPWARIEEQVCGLRDFERLRVPAAAALTVICDDGQSADMLNDAEVVLVGASRTSKTPTCVYLAIRGVRAANVPLVPNIPVPPQLLAAQIPLIVKSSE